VKDALRTPLLSLPLSLPKLRDRSSLHFYNTLRSTCPGTYHTELILHSPHLIIILWEMKIKVLLVPHFKSEHRTWDIRDLE
jgi:hypothetical protein